MSKRFILCLVIFLLITGVAYAGQELGISDTFQFDESKMDVGSVYHYIGSDIEGKNAIDFYVYVKSKNEITIYKAYNTLIPGSVYLINATFDWKHMMRSKIEAVNPVSKKLPDAEIETKVDVDFENNKVSISYTRNDKAGNPKTTHNVYKYKEEPCFDYGLLHFDLQFALRFIKENLDKFNIYMSYAILAVESNVKYLGDEEVNHVLCRKYEIKAEGIIARALNAKSYIWLAKNDPRHYTVKYMSYMQKDSFWKNFKLELKDIKTMDSRQWDSFVKQMIDKAELEIQ